MTTHLRSKRPSPGSVPHIGAQVEEGHAAGIVPWTSTGSSSTEGLGPVDRPGDVGAGRPPHAGAYQPQRGSPNDTSDRRQRQNTVDGQGHAVAGRQEMSARTKCGRRPVRYVGAWGATVAVLTLAAACHAHPEPSNGRLADVSSSPSSTRGKGNQTTSGLPRLRNFISAGWRRRNSPFRSGGDFKAAVLQTADAGQLPAGQNCAASFG